MNDLVCHWPYLFSCRKKNGCSIVVAKRMVTDLSDDDDDDGRHYMDRGQSSISLHLMNE